MTKLLSAVFISFLIISCNSGQAHKERVKFDQYMVEGERLYQQHCSNCHQLNGEGVGKLFPPIVNSDYLIDNVESVACLIRNGIEGEITVNGVQYNQPMPGVAELTNLEVAEIVTYIYNSWGQKQGIIGVKDVSRYMEKCE